MAMVNYLPVMRREYIRETYVAQGIVPFIEEPSIPKVCSINIRDALIFTLGIAIGLLLKVSNIAVL